MGIKAVDPFSIGEGMPARYKAGRCDNACKDPDSPLCVKCTALDEASMRGNKGKIFHGMWAPRSGSGSPKEHGPLHPLSHIEGSNWNVAGRAKAAGKAKPKAKAKAASPNRVSVKAKAKAKSKSASPNKSVKSKSKSKSASPNKRVSVKAKAKRVKSGVSISEAAATIIAASKKAAASSRASSSSSSSSSSRKSRRRSASSKAKMYVPVSAAPRARAASASPPRLIPAQRYEGWRNATPLSSSETRSSKVSGNADVLEQIQAGLAEHPKLAPPAY